MAELHAKITAESAGESPYEFDSVTIDAGNAFEPSTDQAAAGSYSYKVVLAGTNRNARGVVSFVAQDEVYVKFELYIDALTYNAWESGYLATIMTDDYGTILLGLKAGRTGGATVDRWFTIGQGLAGADTTTNFAFDQWLTVILHWKQGAGDAIHRVTIEGTVIREQTDGTSAGEATKVYVGHIGGDNPTGGTVYFDEIEYYDAIPGGGGVEINLSTSMDGVSSGAAQVSRIITAPSISIPGVSSEAGRVSRVITVAPVSVPGVSSGAGQVSRIVTMPAISMPGVTGMTFRIIEDVRGMDNANEIVTFEAQGGEFTGPFEVVGVFCTGAAGAAILTDSAGNTIFHAVLTTSNPMFYLPVVRRTNGLKMLTMQANQTCMVYCKKS